MKISVTCEHILYRTPGGEYWVQGAPLSFWQRYCEVFSELEIVGRVAEVTSPPEGAEPLAHARVSVAAVPYYRGPVQFARRYFRVRAALRAVAESAEAILMRTPSTLANLLTPTLIAGCRPYGVEVLGDPRDVFAPGVVEHPLRPVLRQWFSRNQRRQCAGASVVAYVTEKRLQARYPAAANAWRTHYSSLVLPDGALVANARVAEAFGKSSFNLITVAKLAQMYKGVDVLIDALATCVRQGLDVRLAIVGDGAFREQLSRQAVQRGVGERVHFHGFVPGGEPVRRLLDAADLFVLASRTEGLPRSMIEAMARGLPCLGSTAGGIPELLPDDAMTPPGDAGALAEKIGEVLGDPARLAAMSARNRQHAENYREEKLRARREELYQRLKQATASWLREGSGFGVQEGARFSGLL